MLGVPIGRWIKSNIENRIEGIAFSLPRGERMRCGVFYFLFAVFKNPFFDYILQNS